MKNILILFKERNSWLSGNRGKGLQMKSVGMVQRRWLLFLQVFVAIAALCMQGRPPIITSIDAYTPVSTPEIHFRGMSPYRRPGGSPLEGHNKELDNPENLKNTRKTFFLNLQISDKCEMSRTQRRRVQICFGMEMKGSG